SPGRRFAIERWPLLEAAQEAMTTVAAEARAAARATTPAPIVGSDRDPQAIERARANAARAELDPHIELACRDVGDARPPAAPRRRRPRRPPDLPPLPRPQISRRCRAARTGRRPGRRRPAPSRPRRRPIENVRCVNRAASPTR